MGRKLLIVCTVIAMLSACGSSPPIRHYLLQPTADKQAQPLNIAVGVGPVSVAEFLRTNAIVTSEDGFQLHTAELDQWGEPLGDGIARVVAENLTQLTGSENIRGFPWRSDEQPGIAVKIEVLSLNASDNVATLRLHWTLRQPGATQPVKEGYSRYESAVNSPTGGSANPSTYSAIARAYSDLLTQFCQDLAQVIHATTVE